MCDRSLENIWAKSPSDGNAPVTLAAHTCAVIRRLLQLRSRCPDLPDLTGNPFLWSHAFWACWLHDFGKAAEGFQAMLRGGPVWGRRHEVLSVAFAVQLFSNAADLQWIVAGIASHHKDWRPLRDRYPDLLPEDWDAGGLIRQISPADSAALLKWATEEGSATLREAGLAEISIHPAPEQPPSVTCIKEALTRAMGDYYRLARTCIEQDHTARIGIVMRGLVTQADHLASARAGALQDTALPDPDEWFHPDATPYDHQLHATHHDGSLFLSAPTGSGKTEAALLWAKRQQESRSGGLIYLLPYQASLNAMSERLQDALHRPIATVHARSLETIYRTLLEGGEAPADAERKARAANSLAHLNVPGIRLTTPFQLLKGAYRLRGYEAIWTNLAQSLIVVDEIHAYEPVRLGMVLGMLRELQRRWGARICITSATLPSWLREVIEDTLGITLFQANPELYQRFSRHRIETVPDGFFAEQVLNRIRAELREGKKVLLVANTVATAQRLYEALAPSLSVDRTILLHSRFTAGDRARQEIHLRSCAREFGPFLAVGTQTVEVSLDLDFDRLWTEPAPLEALIQRFGRVNRRGSKGIVPVRILRDSEHDSSVYDPELKRRSFELLMAHEGETIHEAMLSEWIDEIYSTDFGPEYARTTRHSIGEFEATCLARLVPFDSDRQIERLFTRLFDGDEAIPIEFRSQYAERRKNAPLDARQLLVPMRFGALARTSTWDDDLDIWVVDRPYHPKLGLQLHRTPQSVLPGEESP